MGIVRYQGKVERSIFSSIAIVQIHHQNSIKSIKKSAVCTGIMCVLWHGTVKEHDWRRAIAIFYYFYHSYLTVVRNLYFCQSRISQSRGIKKKNIVESWKWSRSRSPSFIHMMFIRVLYWAASAEMMKRTQNSSPHEHRINNCNHSAHFAGTTTRCRCFSNEENLWWRFTRAFWSQRISIFGIFGRY